MALPHAGRRAQARHANRDPCSFGGGAAKGPWPPTRRRRPSVLDWMPRPLTDARVTTFLLARFCNLIFSSFRLPMCFLIPSLAHRRYTRL
jgi:hypothetical protein